MKTALETWADLNEWLKTCDETSATKILNVEKVHARRPTFLLRIYSRINKLRADRERKELLDLCQR
jgi:hypothetical protein